MLSAWSIAGLVVLPLATAGGLLAQTRPAQGPPLLMVQGRGVQVYRCADTNGKVAWQLDHPEAELLNGKGKVVGHHDAGPAWRLDDGSTVEGEVLEKTPAPEPRAVPWLLLRVTRHQGEGALTAAATIRRTETHGGAAPIEGCDDSMVGATVRVPYTAIYTFYGKP